MSDERPPQENLGDEFRSLGNNLLEALRSVWASPERRRLTEELESNLNEFSATVRKEVESFNDSPTGQRLKDDVDSLGGKVRDELNDNKVKEELLTALRKANEELAKVIERWSGKDQSRAGNETPPEDAPTSEGTASQEEA